MRRLAIASVLGLLVLVAQPGPVTAAPPAAGALRLTFNSRSDCETKATDITFTLTKAPGTEGFDIAVTKAVLTVDPNTTQDLNFAPADLAPGITRAVATTQVPLGKAVQVQVEFTLTQEDGSTSDSAVGLSADPVPGPVACPALDASTSTTTPLPPATTAPAPPTPPAPPGAPGTPVPARPLPGSANFTG